MYYTNSPESFYGADFGAEVIGRHLKGITQGMGGSPAPKPATPQLLAVLSAIKDPPGTPPVVTLPAHMTTPSPTATTASTAHALEKAAVPSVPLHAAAIGAVGTGVGWAVAGPVGGAIGAGAGGVVGAIVAKVRQALHG